MFSGEDILIAGVSISFIGIGLSISGLTRFTHSLETARIRERQFELIKKYLNAIFLLPCDVSKYPEYVQTTLEKYFVKMKLGGFLIWVGIVIGAYGGAIISKFI